MSKVTGKNVLVFIDGQLYACATSVTLNVSSEFIETSVSGTGTFATFLPTKTSFTGSLQGIVSLEEPSMLSLSDLRAKQINQDLLTIKFQRTDADGNIYNDTASFYISSSSDTGTFDGMNTFSIELIGTGAITQTFTDEDPPIYKVYTAYLNQTGTAAPVATIKENTLSGTVVWLRTTAGQYEGILADFVAGKTFIKHAYGAELLPDTGTDFQFFSLSYVGTGQIRVFSQFGPSGTLANSDDLLINYPIEIRVYP